MTTRSLEDHEIKSIFGHIDGTNAKRNEMLLIVGIGLALRASELVGLEVGDVYDGENAKSYVTIRACTAKFNKERLIRIGDDIQSAIVDFIAWKEDKRESVSPSAPLFVSQKGGHLTRQALFEIVKRIFRKAKIDQSPHCLRKTGGTIYYIESDYDLIATQQFLGHTDPSTTRKYIGLTTNQVVEYAEKLSDHLFSAILVGRVGEFDSNVQIYLGATPTVTLIGELAKRDLDVDYLIQQVAISHNEKASIMEDKKVIHFPIRKKT
jgi:integrase/recombinase XerD